MSQRIQQVRGGCYNNKGPKCCCLESLEFFSTDPRKPLCRRYPVRVRVLLKGQTRPNHRSVTTSFRDAEQIGSEPRALLRPSPLISKGQSPPSSESPLSHSERTRLRKTHSEPTSRTDRKLVSICPKTRIRVFGKPARCPV
jgi:hypothetical protein